MSNPILIIKGNIIHSVEPFSTHTLEKGFVIVRSSKIVAIDYLSALDETLEKLKLTEIVLVKTLKESQLLLPGLIDTHIHAPQYPNAGIGYDKPLLEWLETYTYPVEKKFSDAKYARNVYDAIVKKTLDFGTTTACYFGTLYHDTTMELVEAAITKGQRAFVGKVNMIKNSFWNYVETSDDSVKNTETFIQAVLAKRSPLVQPIITPRFALSVDLVLMKELSKLARKYNLNIQSHISENKDEITMVENEYGITYAEAYNNGELLTSKTVLAHGVHLKDKELEILAAKGTSVSHCPLSNTLLKSGICDVKKLVQHGLKVGLGTDVAGGSSSSMINSMRSAIQTSIHLSYSKNGYDPLDFNDVFYLATLGGAKALAIDDKVGNFQVGKDFDAIIIDMDVKNSSADYLHDSTPMELLQKFVFLGDDRNVINVYVAGKEVKSS